MTPRKFQIERDQEEIDFEEQVNLHLNSPKSFSAPECNIAVVGLGGAGGNAVDMMIESKLDGVEFFCINTDAQALSDKICKNKIQIGKKSTQGLGTGSDPELGKKAMQDDLEGVLDRLSKFHLVFLVAGLGGGTGTGATPLLAEELRKRGILTVAIISTPFSFEGKPRERVAAEGIKELEKSVDTMIVVPNEQLLGISDTDTSVEKAFHMSNEVFYEGVKGLADLIIKSGLINLDFADVQTVMTGAGRAFIASGVGENEKEGRGKAAVMKAFNNPLLAVESVKGATSVLLSIYGGEDLTLHDVRDAANAVKQNVNDETNIILGATIDPQLKGKVKVLLVVTGIPRQQSKPQQVQKTPQKKKDSKAGKIRQFIKDWW